MGKFDDPEPDFVPPQNMVELKSMDDALKLLDEWIEAYDELRREYVRLHKDYIEVRFMAECLDTLAKNEEFLRRHGVAEEGTSV